MTTLAFADTPDPVEQARALLSAGCADEALALLEKAVENGRSGLLARTMLVRARLAVNDMEGAISLGRELANLNAGRADVALALGEALLQAEALPEAISELNRALRLDASFEEARLVLARAWLEAGEPDRADVVLKQVSNSPECALLRERAARMRNLSRFDAGYVRHLFDQFSEDYDTSMRGKLRYAAPEILRDLFSMVMPGRKALSVLDLGCGTGLAGEVFRDVAARLDGVDLSPQMVAKARERGIYSSLIVGDMESAAPADSYDLVLAADSLVYLGDLAKTMRAVSLALKPGGQFLFTVENHAGAGFQLGPTRRWRHAESYLREMAAQNGFDIAGLVACSPRREGGEAVEGVACAFQKPALAGKVG